MPAVGLKPSRSAGLDELLRQVALIQADAEMKDLWEIYEVVLASYPFPKLVGGRGTPVLIDYPNKTKEEALNKALEICLERLPELAAYISGRATADDRPPGEPWSWYMFIREARAKLQAIVRGKPVQGISIDSNGIIRAERDRFAEAVDEIDAAFLRECARPDCRRIFFAKQERSKYHTEECRHVMANRLLRYLESKGFPAGAKLKPHEETKKAALTKEWNELHGIRTERNRK